MHITRYGRGIKKAAIIITALTGFIVAFSIPFYTKSMLDTKVGYYSISINGVTVGAANSVNDVNEALANARKKLSAQYSSDVYMNPDIEIVEETRAIANRSSVDELSDDIYSYLFDNVLEVERNFDYTLRVDDYTVTLSSLEEVEDVLNQIVEQYDTLSQYKVTIASSEKIDSGYVVNLEKKSESNQSSDIVAAAIGGDGTTVNEATDVTNGGITAIEFKENVSIVAVPEGIEATASVEDALSQLTEEKTVNESYIVAEDEDLEFIASKYGVTVDDLVKLNPLINANTILVEGDIITVPAKETILTVVTTKQLSFQQEYDVSPEYTDDDSLSKYNNVVTSEGTTGQRYTEANIVYYNNTEMTRSYVTVGMYVTTEATPASISVGTLSSSSFTRPLATSVGTYKSGLFDDGSLNGVIWSVDSGTNVLAANDGTVTKARWYSDYGYVVEIKHSDGTITRYGYLSELNVSEGDTVTKGSVIAKTGNSGAASDNELLFEIWKSGVSLNPLDYVNKN